MSPRLPVPNLSDFCKLTLFELTLDMVKLRGEEAIPVFRDYFRKLPGHLKEAILYEILDLAVLNSHLKWVSFQILGGKISRFDSRQLSPKYHEKFAEELRGVLYLNLTHAKISESSLLQILKHSAHLRVLLIPNLATDAILQQIKTLKNLEMLDISGISRFTPEGLEHLSSESIQVLSIGYSLTHVIGRCSTHEMIFNVIMRLPNLKELRTYQNIGKVLLDLPKPYVSKLKVIGDYDTSQSQMEAIIGVCPHLEELSLEDPEKKSLILLEELRHLKKLKISQVFPDNIRLRTLTLTTLQLNNSIVNSDDLCLTMENLILVSCQLRGFQESRFRNLRMLELIDCDVEKSQILPLLYYCDLIQRLALSNEINLTDKDLKDLCDKQKLKHLEELWLTLAKHLTIDSVILLMNHCDRLIELGTLNGWDVDNVEVNYLRCLVRLSNMKLNFLYFQCF